MRALTIAILLCCLLAANVSAQTTEFTYQGNLKVGTPPNTTPATGDYDFEFRLFDLDVGGAQVGSTLPRNAVRVDAGAFSVKLDFGAQFPGANRWLAISVRQTGGGSFTPLLPRQQISTTPYAVRSSNAANADNAANATTASNALQLGGMGANQFVLTTDPRMSDARNPLPNSGNYIQNQNGSAQAANFNIGGNGRANILDAAMQFNINGVRILSNAGSNNLFAGQNAGTANVNGVFNAFTGSGAGRENTDGSSNAFFGYEAGRFNQTGNSNSFFGALAGTNFNVGSNNTFIGASSALNSSGANENTFVGAVTGFANTSGRGNTMIGFGAGPSIGTLLNATAVGNRAFVTQNNSLVLGSITGVNACSAATDCSDTKVGIGTTAPTERLHVVGNGLFTGNVTFSGALNGNGSGLTNLNAANITTGTLAINRGGTGLAAPGAAGNFLRSNGTGWTSSALQTTDIPNLGGTYLQNTTSAQTANFNISGNGIIGGNLGIGPGTPGYRLDVVGRSRFRQNDGDTGATNTAGFWFYQNAPAMDRAFVGMESDNAVGFYGPGGGWGLVMSVLTGNVGVGTREPTSALHVVGQNVPAVGSGNGINASPVLQISGGRGGDSADSNGGVGGTATIQGGTGGTGFFVGGAGGDVTLKGGIGGATNDGFSAPGGSVLLQGGNGNSLGGSVILQGGNTSSNSFSRVHLQPNGGQLHITNGKWVFGASDTPADSAFVYAGSPGVISLFGGTAPRKLTVSSVGATRFFVNSDLHQDGSLEAGIGLSLWNQPKWSLVTEASNGGLKIHNDASAQTFIWITSNGSVGIGNPNPAQKLNVNGTVGLLLSGGGFTAVCQNPTTFALAVCSSSIRYKNNVSDFGESLSLIRRLRPVSFNWREGAVADLGLIAEEVADVEPRLVVRNDKGEVEGVKYDRVGVIAINAIKEQQAEIDSLKQQIAALKELLCVQNKDADICHK